MYNVHVSQVICYFTANDKASDLWVSLPPNCSIESLLPTNGSLTSANNNPQ